VVSLSALALTLAAVRGGTTTPVAYHTAWAAMAVIAAVLVAAVFALRSPAERSEPAEAVPGPART
jgi:hypothetical protein